MLKDKKHIILTSALLGTCGGVVFSLISFILNFFSWIFPILGIVIGEFVFLYFFVQRFFYKKGTSSVLEIINVETCERTTLKVFENTIIESPNWRKDENAILYNSNGFIFSYNIDNDTVEKIDIGDLKDCNNDHVLSPDGTGFAISCNKYKVLGSQIYTLKFGSSESKLITPKSPSYLHGWSPDGNTLVYCAKRNGQFDIYAKNINGTDEIQLTSSKGHNDGCEYSPDGKHIWFNSARDGLMQIYRMDCDGKNVRRITDSKERNSWFAHVSPKGDKIVYLAFNSKDIEPEEHLPDKNIQIRLMNYDGSNDRVIAEFYGGQGSFNTNSWSPDGKYIACVRYEPPKKYS